MASEKKVRRLLSVSNSIEQTNQIIQQIYESMGANYEKAGDKEGALFTDVSSELYDLISDKLDKLLLSFYKDFFTDSEIDELITFYSSPIYQKLRERSPEISNSIIAFFSENEEDFKNKAEKIFLKKMGKIAGNLKNRKNTHSLGL